MDYTVPNGGELLPLTVRATVDGTSAASDYFATVQVVAPSGRVMGSFITSSIAAGASADVTWFPGLGVGSGSGGGSGGIRRIIVPLTTADASGNAYPIFTFNQGFTTVRNIVPGFQNLVNGAWAGQIPIPPDYVSGGSLTLRWTVNINTGNVAWQVGSRIVNDGEDLDGSYTNETQVVVAAPGTALNRVTTAFTLSTSPVAGKTLQVNVMRNGANVADTCTKDAILYSCEFAYTSAY